MTKQEIALLNFSQRIATGKLAVDIGDKLSFGENPYELLLKLRQLRQLHKLFDYEYGKPEGSLELLMKTVLAINSLINNYRLNGTYEISETVLVPSPIKFANLIIIGEGSGGEGGQSLQAGNGTHLKFGRINLGLDEDTLLGPNPVGLIRSPVRLLYGNPETPDIYKSGSEINLRYVTQHVFDALNNRGYIETNSENGLAVRLLLNIDSRLGGLEVLVNALGIAKATFFTGLFEAGIEYDADISETFGLNSLVTKKFVLDKLSDGLPEFNSFEYITDTNGIVNV